MPNGFVVKLPDPDAEVLYGCYTFDNVLLKTAMLRPSWVSRFPVCRLVRGLPPGKWRRIYIAPSDLYGYVAGLYDKLYASLESEDWFTRIFTIQNLLTAIAVAGITMISLGGSSVLGPEIAAFIAKLSVELQTVANALHLKTALKIHNISMLISKDYRKMWSGFYGKLSKVSEGLGYDAYYLALVFRNSRQLIIDSSTTMGFSYDEADMIWLDKFDKYLTVFAKNAESYANDPEALFHDLDQYLDKPAVDDKATFISRWFVNFNNVVSVVDVTVKDLIVVRKDIDNLVRDLPEKISAQVKPWIDNVLATFDDFIEDKYEPAILELKQGLDIFGVKLDKDVENLFILAKRLRKPVDYLLEIDNLAEGVKIEQQEKLNELVTRSLHSEADSLYDISGPTRADLLAIGEAERIPTTPLVGLPPEFPTPITPAGVKPKRRETWFVGDY